MCSSTADVRTANITSAITYLAQRVTVCASAQQTPIGAVRRVVVVAAGHHRRRSPRVGAFQSRRAAAAQRGACGDGKTRSVVEPTKIDKVYNFRVDFMKQCYQCIDSVTVSVEANAY